MSSAPLSFPDCLTGRSVSLALIADGNLQSRQQLYAHIMLPLELIKTEARFFAHHRRQQALPPLGPGVAECSPCERVRLMLCCVAFACQRLTTAPADMRMTFISWGWVEVVMERVTRGRVRRVQVQLQQRARWPVLACAVCLTRVAGNGGWFSGLFSLSQRLLQARCGVHSCVQAAATARVAGGPYFWKSVRTGDSASVLCHLIADAEGINNRNAL